MTAQRKRRGRKPGTILRHIANYADYVGCGCRLGEECHDSTNVTGCARAHFASLVPELRAALNERQGGMRGSDADPTQKTCSQCTVARYLAQRLDPLVALAATDIRVHNALVAIATDGRKLAAGTEQGRG